MRCCGTKKEAALGANSKGTKLETPKDARSLLDDELVDFYENLVGFWNAKKITVQENPYFMDSGLFGPYTCMEVSKDGVCQLKCSDDGEETGTKTIETFKLTPKNIISKGKENLAFVETEDGGVELSQVILKSGSDLQRNGSPLESDRRRDRRATAADYYMGDVNPNIKTVIYLDDCGTRLGDNAILVFSCQDVEITNDMGWRIRWEKTSRPRESQVDVKETSGVK